MPYSQTLPASWRRRRALARSTADTALLVRLSFDPDRRVREAVAVHAFAPQGTLAHLGRDSDRRVRAVVAARPTTPLPALVLLSQDGEPTVNSAARRNPSLPPHVLGNIRDQPRQPQPQPLTETAALATLLADGGAAFAAARRGRGLESSPEVLFVLAHSPILAVREVVAGHGFHDPATLEMLACSPEPGVLEGVADNYRTPPATLAALMDRATGGRSRLGLVLARNSRTPTHALDQLSRTGGPAVRAEIAAHPAVSQATLARSASDDHLHVVDRAARNNRTPPLALARLVDRLLPYDSGDRRDGQGVGRSPWAPPGPVAGASELSSWEQRTSVSTVLGHVASNPSTPQSSLERLGVGRRFRDAIAQNPRAPSHLLARFAAEARPWGYDDDDDVVDDGGLRISVGRHASTPPQTLERLLRSIPGYRPEPILVSAIAGNPSTPLAVLAELSHRFDPEVREAVARNSATSTQILDALRDDEHRRVRDAAWNR